MKQDERLRKFPWAISFTKCKNCGRTVPISLDLAKTLIQIMGEMMNLPEIVLEKEEDYKNYYFVVGYCMYCVITLQQEERNKKLELEIKKVEK